MSFSSHNEYDRSAGAIEAEKTLRLIATLPAPEGIEDRLKAGLRSAPRQVQLISWPLAAGSRNSWMRNSAMRVAAAAAIVIVVAGGGWEVYSHIRVAPEPAAVTTPQPMGGRSGLSAAETKRVPQTLEGPVIAVPVTKKKTAIHPGAISSTHSKRASAKKPTASVQVQP
ncbi:MAG TPA: hypothetical protein VGI45_18770 [Terracidiphilus sp.]|jgi:hypothetical protein